MVLAFQFMFRSDPPSKAHRLESGGGASTATNMAFSQARSPLLLLGDQALIDHFCKLADSTNWWVAFALIGADATAENAKAVGKKLLRLHPDKCKLPEAAEAFRKVNHFRGKTTQPYTPAAYSSGIRPVHPRVERRPQLTTLASWDRISRTLAAARTPHEPLHRSGRAVGGLELRCGREAPPKSPILRLLTRRSRPGHLARPPPRPSRRNLARVARPGQRHHRHHQRRRHRARRPAPSPPPPPLPPPPPPPPPPRPPPS